MLSVSISTAFATTTIGGATLTDTATVNSGTVTPTSYLSYVSGGNGATGWADGSTYGSDGFTAAGAMSSADHHWLQYDPAILVYSPAALSSVLAIPAIAAIPEPETYAMLLAGLGLLGFAARRRK